MALNFRLSKPWHNILNQGFNIWLENEIIIIYTLFGMNDPEGANKTLISLVIAHPSI